MAPGSASAEVAVSDPERPALPDPQQDRHVAFPDLTPSTGSAAQPAPLPGLPPDAWARHKPNTGPTSTPPLPPAILSTPPTVPAHRTGRRRPAWLAFAAIVGVFLVMGNVSPSNDEWTPPFDGGHSEQRWGGSDPDEIYDAESEGWIESVVDLETRPPLPRDTKVSPVPPDTEMLRIEVVAQTEEPVALQISTDNGLDDETPDGATPLVREVRTGTEMHEVDVTVTSTSGTDVPVQCRIYAGRTLVALSTSPVEVSCSAHWP
jgi:hypothetical protein